MTGDGVGGSGDLIEVSSAIGSIEEAAPLALRVKSLTGGALFVELFEAVGIAGNGDMEAEVLFERKIEERPHFGVRFAENVERTNARSDFENRFAILASEIFGGTAELGVFAFVVDAVVSHG